MIADKLSRLGQTFQIEWSLLPEVFQLICSQWHQPQIDLFATRFNNLPWEDLEPYDFSLVAILGKVVEKLQDYPFRRIILIAPGWPNMPRFCDLVAMSSQIPWAYPTCPSQLSPPAKSTIQSVSTQESAKPTQVKKFYFDHGLAWMSMDVQGHKSMGLGLDWRNQEIE